MLLTRQEKTILNVSFSIKRYVQQRTGVFKIFTIKSEKNSFISFKDKADMPSSEQFVYSISLRVVIHNTFIKDQRKEAFLLSWRYAWH